MDFIDNKNKIVYELKPKANGLLQVNIEKENALIIWCKCNNFLYIKINEDYFKNINFKEKEKLFKKHIVDYNRISKFKIYFKNEN